MHLSYCGQVYAITVVPTELAYVQNRLPSLWLVWSLNNLQWLWLKWHYTGMSLINSRKIHFFLQLPKINTSGSPLLLMCWPIIEDGSKVKVQWVKGQYHNAAPAVEFSNACLLKQPLHPIMGWINHGSGRVSNSWRMLSRNESPLSSIFWCCSS